MKVGVLGTGSVGMTIGTKLVELGHAVTMGSRSATNERAAEWAASAGAGAGHGTFADAAAFGELVFNCTSVRGPEMYLPLWLRLMGAVDHANFNIKVVS